MLEVLEDTPGALRVSVESTLGRLRCAHCGFKCHRVHDRRGKKVRDLAVSGRAVTLVWPRRRMRCDNCGSRFLEDHHAFEGGLTGHTAACVKPGEAHTPGCATVPRPVSTPTGGGC